ncbi:MAG: ABC transporter permease [Pseudomonadota bacterium]
MKTETTVIDFSVKKGWAKAGFVINVLTLLFLSFKELWTERRFGLNVIINTTLKQIYFTGIEALKIITLISLIIGAAVIIESGAQLEKLGGESLIAPILIMVIIRELGPLLTAFIVIGRSGTAIATELGNMVIAHEIEAVEVMGISPIHFIIAPRIIGVTIAVIVLSVYFNLVAMVGGLLLSTLITNSKFSIFLHNLATSLTLTDIFVSLLKSLIFGLIISLVCSYNGLSVRFSSTEVPQAATRGVVNSILSCFIINFIITLLFYL